MRKIFLHILYVFLCKLIALLMVKIDERFSVYFVCVFDFWDKNIFIKKKYCKKKEEIFLWGLVCFIFDKSE